MDRVHSVQQNPFDQVRPAGIAIRDLDSQQRHMGILHRDLGAKEVRLLHLAWHLDLRNETPIEGYLWIDPAVPSRRLTQLAAVCRMVWLANGRDTIPYGFSPPSDCMDADTGKYLVGPTQHGLTCATFVLAVFHRAGLPLVQYASWPVGRPGDAEWQQRILEALRRSGRATPEHIHAVENDVGTVRFRPEEVAGAATVSPLPADFGAAERRGRELLARLGNS
jgi:hypothetical protein